VPRYGNGRVQVAAGDEITVEFPDGQIRTFLRGYVRLRRPSAIAMMAPMSTSAGQPSGGRAVSRVGNDDMPDDAPMIVPGAPRSSPSAHGDD
jgi:hypothetical protein